MGYENAAATKLLATHCCACARPLVDAKSVELGIGPICRKKYGYDLEGVSEPVRKAVNGLVFKVAANPQSLDSLAKIETIRGLGFTVLADRLESRIATVRVLMVEGRVRLVTPYNADFVDAIRQIKGRKWHKAEKVWSFPVSARPALWKALRLHFDGSLALGPKGPFAIQAAA
jgi:hypothetical protein